MLSGWRRRGIQPTKPLEILSCEGSQSHSTAAGRARTRAHWGVVAERGSRRVQHAKGNAVPSSDAATNLHCGETTAVSCGSERAGVVRTHFCAVGRKVCVCCVDLACVHEKSAASVVLQRVRLCYQWCLTGRTPSWASHGAVAQEGSVSHVVVGEALGEYSASALRTGGRADGVTQRVQSFQAVAFRR